MFTYVYKHLDCGLQYFSLLYFGLILKMLSIIFLNILLSKLTNCAFSVDTSQERLMLMPYPKDISIENSPGMVIDRYFFAEINGDSSDILTNTVKRLYDRIEAQTGLFLLRSSSEQVTSSKLTIMVNKTIEENLQRYNEDEKCRA